MAALETIHLRCCEACRLLPLPVAFPGDACPPLFVPLPAWQPLALCMCLLCCACCAAPRAAPAVGARVGVGCVWALRMCGRACCDCWWREQRVCMRMCCPRGRGVCPAWGQGWRPAVCRSLRVCVVQHSKAHCTASPPAGCVQVLAPAGGLIPGGCLAAAGAGAGAVLPFLHCEQTFVTRRQGNECHAVAGCAACVPRVCPPARVCYTPRQARAAVSGRGGGRACWGQSAGSHPAGSASWALRQVCTTPVNCTAHSATATAQSTLRATA